MNIDLTLDCSIEPKNFMETYKQALLDNTQGVLNYIKDRCISQNTITTENLMYVPIETSMQNSTTAKSNLFHFDIFFKGYIICPIIYNESIVSFTARNFNNDNSHAPKHKHFPGKNNYFIGQGNVDTHIDEVCLTEGLFDYLSAKTKRLNTLGLLGINNFKEIHVRFLLEHFNSIYILTDNDNAGDRGAIEIVKKIHKLNNKEYLKPISCRRFKLNQKDFNEEICKGSLSLQKLRQRLISSEEIIIKYNKQDTKQNKKQNKKQKEYSKVSNSSRTLNKYNTDAILDALRDAGIKPEKSGSKWRVKCINPGHNDTQASLYIYPDAGIYCFGCGMKYIDDFYHYLEELKGHEK